MKVVLKSRADGAGVAIFAHRIYHQIITFGESLLVLEQYIQPILPLNLPFVPNGLTGRQYIDKLSTRDREICAICTNSTLFTALKLLGRYTPLIGRKIHIILHFYMKHYFDRSEMNVMIRYMSCRCLWNERH